MHAYTPACQSVPACLPSPCIVQSTPVSAAGRRFITGTAGRIPLRISAPSRLRLRRRKTFTRPVPRRLGLGKRKVGRREIRRRRRLRVECVRACVRPPRPRFTEKLIARRALLLEVQRVTSPQLFQLLCLIALCSLHFGQISIMTG